MMNHAEKALSEYEKKHGVTNYIGVDAYENDAFPTEVSFKLQSGTVSESGVNGVQCEDIIKYALYLLESLNSTHSCTENEFSIALLKEVILWQEARTKDRELRCVEGTYSD